MTKRWLRWKFYPVNHADHIIYDDPKQTERECSFGDRFHTPYTVTQTGTIGVRGKNLDKPRYADFAVIEPLSV